MNLAVLRVEGKGDVLKGLLDMLHSKPDAEWQAGELKRRGGKYEKSGFSLTVADAPTPHEMVIAVRRFLTECNALGIFFPKQGLTAELSVGLTVGDSVQFVASIDWTSDDLAMMSNLGLGFSVTAYPTSDEANSPQQPATG
ncbi:hypothetical protein [Ralstonia pseudosolanacearum]|uniref:hypothetical protein n=1 Tax=Ralstonia pseudosolanacearum TaxID=1310165 RepID=UPI001FFA5CF3|nr:hypothetical protein [Ralstonia pseudosolanacearum]